MSFFLSAKTALVLQYRNSKTGCHLSLVRGNMYQTGCENSGKVFLDSASDQNSNYSVHFLLIHHLHDKKYTYLQLSVSLIFWEEDDSPFDYIYG